MPIIRPPEGMKHWLPSGAQPYVRIPGWDDIFHFKRPPTVTKEDVKEWYKAKKEGRPPNLTEEQDYFLKKKRQRIIDMQNSPRPEINKLGDKALVWLDDVEDGITSAACLVRLGAMAVPQLRPVAAGLFGVSGLINIVQSLGRSSQGSRSLKSAMYAGLNGNPLTKKGRASIAKKMGRVMPTFGEALEIGQTTDALFGVGLGVGAVMGFLNDGFWNLLAGGKWKRQTLKPLGDRPFVSRATFGSVNTMRCHQEMSLDDHLLTQVVLNGSLSTWPEYWDIESLYLERPDDLRRPILCPTAINEESREMLLEEGIDPDYDGGWPLPGNPADVTLEELALFLASDTPDAQLKVCDELGESVDRYFYGSMMTDVPDLMVSAVEGSYEIYKESPRSETLAMLRMVERGLYPPDDTTQEVALKVVYALARDYDQLGGEALTNQHIMERLTEICGGYKKL